MTATVRMFVNGEAMSGGRLHVNLAGATVCGPYQTASRYRFFSVRDEFPGLHPVAEGGQSIAGELYEVSYATLRESLLPDEPPELELGIIEMADGSGSLSMWMRAAALDAPGVRDITSHGGWRQYLASIGRTGQ
jgi:gamma-glutamylcyclotransferase (GGCT)/AIG2-like uncharacterized protein YtfP